MKLSPREVDDLLTLVEHARMDIAFGSEGSYLNIGEMDAESRGGADKKAIKKSERAIDLIKRIIIQRD